MIPSLVISSIWAILLLVIYLLLQHWKNTDKNIYIWNGWSTVLVVALLARLVPVMILPDGAIYDIESYQIVADLTIQHQDVYTHPDAERRHPYLPFQIYWITLARWLSTHLNLSFAKTVKLAPVAADIAISVLLYFSLRRISSPQAALYGGLLYAINPVTIYVSAYHGQFDAIPALFLLLALSSLSRSSVLSGAWLGLGILSKSWPVLAFPTLFCSIPSRRSRWIFWGLALAIPILGVAFYAFIFQGNPLHIINRAISYNHGIGVWGYTYLLRLFSQINPSQMEIFTWAVKYGRWITLSILGLTWIYKARKESTSNSILTILVIFLAGTHAFAIQYMMWVVPFALLVQDFSWLRRYTIGAFIYMFLAYNTLILAVYITNLLPWPQADWYIIMLAGLPAWLITVGWALSRTRIIERRKPHLQSDGIPKSLTTQ